MKRGSNPARPVTAMTALARSFRRNGYVRRQDTERLATEGAQSYKKGEEVRLVAHSAEELRTLKRLLHEAGFEPGRPFVKGRQHRLPLYGRQEVARFLAAVEAEGEV